MRFSKQHIGLVVLSLLLFVPFLGSVHLFDWDEINFAESAREMIMTGDYFRVRVNYEPFWEKPPLFFWLQAASMHLFGIGEFAARFPNAICGVVTLLVLFSIGRKHRSERFAWIWVLLYAGSFLPHLYFKSGIIDPWFNLFIFLSVYEVYLGMKAGATRTAKHFALAGTASGLAVLTKGPVGLLLLLLTCAVWLVFTRFKVLPKVKQLLAFGVPFTVVCSLWFGAETIQNGPWFLVEFIAYQVDLFLHPVAGHKQPFFYHFVVVLIGCFPLSVLALPAFSKSYTSHSDGFDNWMKYLFWVVLILFSIVTTKIVHYSSMTYIPLSFLAAAVVDRIIASNQSLATWQRWWLLIQGLIISLALTALPILSFMKDRLVEHINDPFAVKNIEAMDSFLGWEWVIGVAYATILIVSVWRYRNQLSKGIVILCLGTALTIFSTMVVVVPVIESASQRSAISFFESVSKEDAHIATYGYKSYAHFFYGDLKPENALPDMGKNLNAATKPIYVSVIHKKRAEFEERFPQATLLSEKGGFGFYLVPNP